MAHRINYIDRMKEYAIIIVVIGHLYLLPFGMNDSFFTMCSVRMKCISRILSLVTDNLFQ